MTPAESRPRYVLYRKLAEGEIDSYAARGPAGDPVLVHLFTGAPDRGRRLLRGLDRLPDPARERVRAVESVDGAPVIVTDRLDRFESLPAWLDAWLARRSPPEGSVSPPSSAPPEAEAPSGEAGSEVDEPGEFTRLFVLGEGVGASEKEPEAPTPAGEEEEGGTGPRRRATPETDAAGSEAADAFDGDARGSDPGADRVADGRDGDDEPGEFTRLFLMSDLSTSAEAPAASGPVAEPPTAAKEPPAAAEPPAAEEPPAPPEPPVAPEQASATADPPPAVPDPPPPARPPAEEHEEGPGEFTRLFGGGDREASEAGWADALGGGGGSWDEPGDPWDDPGGPSGEEDDYLERLGGGGSPLEDPPSPSSAPVEPEPAGPPSGPSRYTRVLQGGTAGAGGPPEPRSPSPPPPDPSGGGPRPTAPSRRPYILALIVIVVLTIGLIVAFALLANGGDEAPDGEPPAEAPAAPGAPPGEVTPPAGGG